MGFLIKLGHHVLTNFPYAMKEVESMEDMVLLTSIFRRHDPKGVVQDHCKMVKLMTSYDHERYLDD